MSPAETMLLGAGLGTAIGYGAGQFFNWENYLHIDNLNSPLAAVVTSVYQRTRERSLLENKISKVNALCITVGIMLGSATGLAVSYFANRGI